MVIQHRHSIISGFSITNQLWFGNSTLTCNFLESPLNNSGFLAFNSLETSVTLAENALSNSSALPCNGLVYSFDNKIQLVISFIIYKNRKMYKPLLRAVQHLSAMMLHMWWIVDGLWSIIQHRLEHQQHSTLNDVIVQRFRWPNSRHPTMDWHLELVLHGQHDQMRSIQM